ncbi:MAG TPA: hypothetical protein VHM90_11965, partial [Phycisphaerae bacterium]|nr:hypothetical protein [Phycisphaerae bacterium]
MGRKLVRLFSIFLACAAACDMLLWIRSIWAIDVISCQSGSTIKGINSSNGEVTLVFAQNLS